MKNIRWALSYIFMSMAAIGFALYVTSALVGRSYAQGTPHVDAPPSAAPLPPPAAAATAKAPTEQLPSSLLEESKPMEQTAIQNTSDDFVFDSTGLRDPFKPFKTIKAPDPRSGTATSNKVVTEILDPLQNLEVETLELVAILWDVKNPRALVKTKLGSTFTLKRDTKVGRNNGVVAGIREGEVIILETVEEEGRPFKQYKTIKMATVESKINKVSN